MTGTEGGTLELKRVVKKICLVGDAAVGKTSLIKRFVFDMFENSYLPTLIGTKVVKSNVELPHKGASVTLLIWDIMGHKTPSTIPKSYYEGMRGVLAVCDVTKKSSLANLAEWVRSVHAVSGTTPLHLLANKTDLAESAVVTKEDLDAVASKYSAAIFLTSAKTGSGVKESFTSIADVITEPGFPSQRAPSAGRGNTERGEG